MSYGGQLRAPQKALIKRALGSIRRPLRWAGVPPSFKRWARSVPRFTTQEVDYIIHGIKAGKDIAYKFSRHGVAQGPVIVVPAVRRNPPRRARPRPGFARGQVAPSRRATQAQRTARAYTKGIMTGFRRGRVKGYHRALELEVR